MSQKKAENSTFFLLIHIEGGEIKRNLHRLGETSHSLPWGNHPTPPIFSFSDKKGFNLWAPKNKIPFSFLKYFYLSSHFLVRFLRILSENIEKCFLSREHLLIEQIHRKISSLGDWKCENPTNPIASLFLSNRLRLLPRNILIKYFLSNICFNFLIFCVVSGGKRLQKRYSSHKLWQNFGGRTPIFHQSQEWVCTFVRNMTSLIHTWYRGAHCSCVKKETIFPIGQKLSGQYFSQLPNYSQTFPNIINKTLILGGAEIMWWWILLDPNFSLHIWLTWHR